MEEAVVQAHLGTHVVLLAGQLGVGKELSGEVARPFQALQYCAGGAGAAGVVRLILSLAGNATQEVDEAGVYPSNRFHYIPPCRPCYWSLRVNQLSKVPPSMPSPVRRTGSHSGR